MTEKSLSLFDTPLTMTSREIAELVEKRHDNVARTIESLHQRGVIALPQFEAVSNPGPGPATIRQYRVGKRDSFVVVAQLSPEFTARLVDRWQELEEPRAPLAIEVPQTLAQALRLAADQAERIEQQDAALALAAPKVDFYDRVVERDGLMTATQVGQKLKLSAVKLNQALDSLEVYNQGLKRGRAFRQWFVDKSFGIMKMSEAGYPQPLFTTAGAAWVVEKMTAEGY